MAKSGVGVSEACTDAYQSLKLGKKTRFIIFTVNPEKTEIVVDEEHTLGSNDEDYKIFVSKLPETECRWAVYDFEYEKELGKRSKICFIAWSPDDAKIKDKMLFASSKEALCRALGGFTVEIQATDFDEVAHDAVLDRILKQV